MDQHVRVPLLNILRMPPVVVLKHGPRTMETKVLVKKPLDPRQIFSRPLARGELFVQ